MSIWQWIRFLCGAVLTIGGLFFMVSAIIGNYRFSYVLYRMHAAGMGDTLGILLLFAGLAVLCFSPAFVLRLALIILLLWAGSCVASHLLMRMEIKLGHSPDGTKEASGK